MTRILIVEDDADLALGLKNNLEIDGYDVRVAGDGDQALAVAASWTPALVVLDIMIPGIDGFGVLRALRARDRGVAVLILTARGGETDKVYGLKLGADDYVTKPFGLLELLARVESLLRRRGVDGRGAPGEPAVLRVGDIEVNRAARTVTKNGATIALRPKEFDLLVELAARRGAVVSRLELMQAVWGYSAAVITRTVDTHIGELRRKLESDPASPRHIKTVRSAGYRLDD
jgi:DNA-binding response OmpR family regulator